MTDIHSAQAERGGHLIRDAHMADAAAHQFETAVSGATPTASPPSRARRQLGGDALKRSAAGNHIDDAIGNLKPHEHARRRAAGHPLGETQEAPAGSIPSSSAEPKRSRRLAGGDALIAAAPASTPSEPSPKAKRGRAPSGSVTHPALGAASPKSAPEARRGSDQRHPDAQFPRVASAFSPAALVGLWREYKDIQTTRNSIVLRCQAIVRRSIQGERDTEKGLAAIRAEAAKVWKLIDKGELPAGFESVAYLTVVMRASMEPLEKAEADLTKRIEAMAKASPLWEVFGKGARGLGLLSFGGLLAEAGGSFAQYRGPAALWKRMGLAVIDGERQRKCADAEKAIAHGYNPRRRAWAYVVSENLLRAQGTDGPYRAVYDRAIASKLASEDAAWSADKAKLRRHRHGMRLMVKELLKHLWGAERKLSGTLPEGGGQVDVDTRQAVAAAQTFEQAA